jgi:hypothetical protein
MERARKIPRSLRWKLLAGGLLKTLWASLHHLGRMWGSTYDERRRSEPGDELIENPDIISDHAISFRASAAEVWPWIVQMGWGRGGWYTYRWVDRLLFPANGPSATDIRPDLQDLAAGDRVPDGPPEADCYYVVELLEENKYMVLRSSTHLPKAWRSHRRWVDWTWGFYLDELAETNTRLHYRVRIQLSPRYMRVLYHLLIMPADFIMGRSLLRGLKQRVESEDVPEVRPGAWL